MSRKLQTLIGLEVHVRLDTGRKIFCRCRLPSDMLGIEANSRVCPVCLGHPGALPHLQPETRKYALALALALGATDTTLEGVSRFDRKHYFYADLPSNYQVTQNKEPFCRAITVSVPNPRNPLQEDFSVDIERIHLEQDAARTRERPNSFHIDFNRSGAVLAEIVTKPCLESPDQAVAFLKHIQQVVQWHGLGTGRPEAGDFRSDVNISMHWDDEPPPRWRKEIKNIARIVGVRDAIQFVQRDLSNQLRNVRDRTPTQETLGWNANTGKTFLQRDKEEMEEYWYYPDPDLQPFECSMADIKEARGLLRTDPAEMLVDLHNAGFALDEVRAAMLASPLVAFFLHHAVRRGLRASECQKLMPFLKALEGHITGLTKSGHRPAEPWQEVCRGTFDIIIEGLRDDCLESDHLKVLTERIDTPRTGTHNLWFRQAYGSLGELRQQEGLDLIDPAIIEKEVLALLQQYLEDENYSKQRNEWLAEKNQRVTGFFQGKVMRQPPSGATGRQVHSILTDFFRRNTAT